MHWTAIDMTKGKHPSLVYQPRYFCNPKYSFDAMNHLTYHLFAMSHVDAGFRSACDPLSASLLVLGNSLCSNWLVNVPRKGYDTLKTGWLSVRSAVLVLKPLASMGARE